VNQQVQVQLKELDGQDKVILIECQNRDKVN